MSALRRLSSLRSLLAVGLDLLPWMGLAVGTGLVLPASPQSPLPHPHLTLPLLILVVGALVVAGRRRWSFPPSAPSPEAPSASSVFPSQPDSTAHLAPTQTPPSPPPPQAEDPLAGLADRGLLLDKLSESLDQVPEDPDADGPAPALITLRTTEYRDVTESFGHQAGQKLLTVVAEEVRDVAPPTATTARIADDTFAVLLPKTDRQTGREMGKVLLERFDSSFQVAGHELPIEVSMGLALQPSSDPSFEKPEQMLRASYSAMHQVQRESGDSLKIYDRNNATGSRRLQRRERLRRAIREDELRLHFQPIVHLVSGAPVGAETLVRWAHPERGLLSPAAFIPLAEETGLVGELDRWVFRQALEYAGRWTKGTDPLLDWVSVNMSPQSVEEDLQAWCRRHLKEADLPPGALHLEITERWALREEQPLQPLRDEGVRLSIDDFGTGYSSLRYLRSLNADVLKIDSEFVQALGDDSKTTAIVQFLMNLSLRLDVEVIAEGVETLDQERILRELGCAMAQGYHFSQPVSADTLLDRAGSTLASSK